MNSVDYATPPLRKWRPVPSPVALMFVMTSVVIFGSSLFFPAFHLSQYKDHEPTGLPLLLIGWIGLFDGQFYWLANPAVLIARLFLVGSFPWSLRRAAALVFSLAALVLSVSYSIWTPKEWSCDEGGVKVAQITGMGPGYWLWTGGIALAVVGSIWLLIKGNAGPIK